ncbi:ATP-binding cassette domain-containing protein [candidate division KSB3 bacterium]|uniref:ATP-binding cassette domain-containing protein n=1 Tax=candidate division KSB3 bacterium TaxID=2044937 RepID=A0A9D5Q523_9BACT|nr:ATP-binding cassette domain-containing protein [candidate division KSB3 bacterium]MBD3323878.1 ATP-binding cassette domain-containing protein [candidate division KSB3 bacterium]
MQTPVLATHELSIGYRLRKRGRNVIAEDLSLSLLPGEVVCLIGPNGAGKSTLLRTLTGLHPPLKGQVCIGSKEISTLTPFELARNISIVLTEHVNVGMLSVFALVALGRYPYTDWTGKLSAEDQRVIHWAIEAVGAADLAFRNVNELSDGEQQKVMIARALAQQPHVIILDEPTVFLDLPRRVEMMSLLRHLARDTGTAILLSTHDLELALRTADRIWLMPLGHPIQVGAPEDLVLSGALEHAFSNNGVKFDKYHGSFLITRHQDESVTLRGEGFHALWTQKALEREGFLVNTPPDEAAIQVQVEACNGHVSWQLTMGDEFTRHGTIYELVTTLRKRQAS